MYEVIKFVFSRNQNIICTRLFQPMDLQYIHFENKFEI